MSWLYSQALLEEYSADTCSDGEPSAPLSVMPTPHKFWHRDKMTECSDLSRYGLTCAVLTENHGEAVLTSFLEAFPAKTLALQDLGPESRESEADSGPKWYASFATFDPDSSSWKTQQCSLLGDLELYSETWPRSGLMRNGECWERTTVVPLTYGNESGSWATPTVSGNHNRKGASPTSGDGLATQVGKWPTPKSFPSGPDFARMGRKESGGDDLATAVARSLFPTPRASDGEKGGPNAHQGNNLGRLDEWGGSSNRFRGTEESRGQLNPVWVEWLMGWPLGWTDLEPLEMDRFLEWQQQHSANWSL